MLDRCYNPLSDSYDRYGGSGVTVSSEWRSDFGQFFTDMGDRLAGQSLDRIDPWGDYERGNCRWADTFVQANNRRNTLWVNWCGERDRLADLCRERGLSMSMVRNRIVVCGWELDDALLTPAHGQRHVRHEDHPKPEPRMALGKLRGSPEPLYAVGELPLTFRLSRAERERLALAAKRSGITVSAFVRRACRRAVGEVVAVPAEGGE